MTAGGRILIIFVLVCSLTLAGAARYLADQQRNGGVNGSALPEVQASEANPTRSRGLANMDSYALGLLLGGLRGPLVMFLWTSSETEKTAHNLDDFNTKVEWIRLLQPEFDSVHLFQIWNKAYNISVQMTNLSNKYATILDALDYAQSVNQQRPDDINIIFDTGHVYGQKLGESHEKEYYIARMRLESMADQPLTRVTLPEAQKPAFMAAAYKAGMDLPNSDISFDDQARTISMLVPTSIADRLGTTFGPQVVFKNLPSRRARPLVGVTRDHMDPVLDVDGRLLPALLNPTHPRPANVGPDDPWYDGSELQFLAKYQPFPYGIPPQGFAYNYYTRAQMLERVAHEVELQTSDFVVDSRPGLELKFWGEEEAEEALRAELRLFGLDDSGDKIDIENSAPGADPTHPPVDAIWSVRADPAAAPRALDQFDRSARLYRDSAAALEDHIKRFPGVHDTMFSHIEDDNGYSNTFQADHDFLEGVLNPGRKAACWASATEHYQQALVALDLNVLEHNVEDPLAAVSFPKDPATNEPYTKLSIIQLSIPQRHAAVNAVETQSVKFYKSNANEMGGDREDLMKYVRRCEGRLAVMGSPLFAAGGK